MFLERRFVIVAGPGTIVALFGGHHLGEATFAPRGQVGGGPRSTPTYIQVLYDSRVCDHDTPDTITLCGCRIRPLPQQTRLGETAACRLVTQRLPTLVDALGDQHGRNPADVPRGCAQYVPKSDARVLCLPLCCRSDGVTVSGSSAP